MTNFDEPFPPVLSHKRSALEEEFLSVLSSLATSLCGAATTATSSATATATTAATPQTLVESPLFKRQKCASEEAQEEDRKLPATASPLSPLSSTPLLYSKQQQQNGYGAATAATTTGAGTGFDVVTVNEDALGIVMEFLAPRELLRLSVCNKTLRAKITTRLVVRSAIMHGGLSATTIHELYPLHQSMSIFPVSPQRLLRLVNGKRCEVCCRNRVNHVRPGYGVFLCWDCLTAASYTQTLNTTWVRFKRNPFYAWAVAHPRVVAQLYGKKYFMWDKALYDASNNNHHYDEPCGPVISFTDVERMAAQHSNMDMDATATARSRDNNNNNNNNNSLDLETSLGRTLPLAAEYREFLQTYEECKEAAETAQQERVEKKRLAAERAAINRTTKTLQIVEKLKAALDHPWRDYALEYEKTGLKGKRPCIQLASALADEAFQPYSSAPSKANKAVIADMAQDLNHKYRLLQVRVVDTSWRCFETNDPFTTHLRDYLQKQLVNLKGYILHKNCGSLFFHYLEDKDYLRAMLLLIPEERLGDLLLLSSDEQHHDDVLSACATQIWRYQLKHINKNNSNSIVHCSLAECNATLGAATVALAEAKSCPEAIPCLASRTFPPDRVAALRLAVVRHRLSDLSTFLSNDDPFEKRLKAHLTRNYPSLHDYVDEMRDQRAFFDHLCMNEMFAAMDLLLSGFGDILAGDDDNDGDDDASEDLLQFARNVWHHHNELHFQGTDVRFCERRVRAEIYTSNLRAFEQFQAAANEFCEWMKTDQKQPLEDDEKRRIYLYPNALPYLQKKDFKSMKRAVCYVQFYP